MFTERTSLGLDVHARSSQACAIDTETGEIIRRTLSGDAQEVCAFVNELDVDHGPILAIYEAGPTGYELARALEVAGHRVQVAAPSKLPKAPGDRVKTDKNDAFLLARLGRTGDITPVAVPSRERETARDLARARDDARRDLMTARHRLSKDLLRHGHVYTGGDPWTGKHEAWMRRTARADAEAFGPASQIVYDDYMDAVAHAEARKKRLDVQIEAMAADCEWSDTIRRLACLRGVSTLTAFGLAVEIGHWHRFTGSTIGSYLGLVPSEHSSGASRSQGQITRTGNQHARRLLVEAAWHHKPFYRPGKTLRDRWALAPAAVVERADRGNRRLHKRFKVLDAHNKRHTIATVAIAREMAGWCWSLATMDT